MLSPPTPPTSVPMTRDTLQDIYVRDLQAQHHKVALRASPGAKGNARSEQPHLSADGRYITFGTNATNLSRTATVFPSWTTVPPSTATPPSWSRAKRRAARRRTQVESKSLGLMVAMSHSARRRPNLSRLRRQRTRTSTCATPTQLCWPACRYRCCWRNGIKRILPSVHLADGRYLGFASFNDLSSEEPAAARTSVTSRPTRCGSATYVRPSPPPVADLGRT